MVSWPQASAASMNRFPGFGQEETMDGMGHGSDSEAILSSVHNPASFAVIFDRHFGVIHAYLQRRAGPDLADELAAQAFAVAFDRRARYDAARPDARPWLFGIATNLLARHRRQEIRQLRAFARTGIDPVLDQFDGIEARLDASARRRELAETLARLTPEELDALLLYAWADLSYAEIAQALGIPIGTVRSRLSRARGHVRELLELDRASEGCQPLPREGDR
jgi:RNA polymerase sigma-70 factor, ECF subfamily